MASFTPMAHGAGLDWLATPNAKNKLTGIVAPDSVMTPVTKELLTPYEHQIAGTGRIESIKAWRNADKNLTVEIKGTVQPGVISRSAGAGVPIAPSFNRDSEHRKYTTDEMGLEREWQRAHLWGPGFGDEAAAGMWYAHTEINQVLQNHIAEGFIRNLAEAGQASGHTVELTVTGERFGADEVERFGEDSVKGDFLKAVRYEVEIKDADGERVRTIEMEFGLKPPPDGSFEDWKVTESGRDNLAKEYVARIMDERAESRGG